MNPTSKYNADFLKVYAAVQEVEADWYQNGSANDPTHGANSFADYDSDPGGLSYGPWEFGPGEKWSAFVKH